MGGVGGGMEFLPSFSALGAISGSSCVCLLTLAPLLWPSFVRVTLMPGLEGLSPPHLPPALGSGGFLLLLISGCLTVPWLTS